METAFLVNRNIIKETNQFHFTILSTSLINPRKAIRKICESRDVSSSLQETHNNEIVHEIKNLSGIKRNLYRTPGSKDALSNKTLSTSTLGTAGTISSTLGTTGTINKTNFINATLYNEGHSDKLPYISKSWPASFGTTEAKGLAKQEAKVVWNKKPVRYVAVDKCFLAFRYNSKRFAFQHYLLLSSSKKDVYNKPPLLKSRKESENKNNKIEITKNIAKRKSKITPLFANQKIFTSFKHPIFLCWSVGHRKNKNSCSSHSINFYQLTKSSVKQVAVDKSYASLQNLSAGGLSNPVGIHNLRSCGDKMVSSNKSIVLESAIPLLSESDQVTFVADFRETLSTSSEGTINNALRPTLPAVPKAASFRTTVKQEALGSGTKQKVWEAKAQQAPCCPTFGLRSREASPFASVVAFASLPLLAKQPKEEPQDAGKPPKMICGEGQHFNNMEKIFHTFPGQLLTYGDTIANNIVTTESGQVLYVDSQKITLRKAQTVLIYSQAVIAVLSGEWIKKGTPLMSLSYQKLVTGDIVQGLPKIEQFFEAPVLKDGTFWSDSLQAKLNQFFQEQKEQLPLAEAVRKGFSEIQRVLVEGVQRVYISQGVLIADKHLEVIVRQMTCKGRILYSGDTGFLRNELVSLDKIENVNQVTYGQKALYHPQVRGITDASLESESFLSAASFQETTRVLSRDAIIGKTDLMRGLKERVIVGELIQAGTGLANNSVYNLL